MSITKSPQSQRLKVFIDTTGMSITEFGKQCQIPSSSTLHQVVSEGKVPSTKVLNKIIFRFPQLNYDWVMLGYGEMIDTDKKNKRQVISKEQLEQSESYQEMMDIIDQEVMDEQKPAFSIDVEVLWNRVDSLEKRMSEIEKRLSNINREFY